MGASLCPGQHSLHPPAPPLPLCHLCSHQPGLPVLFPAPLNSADPSSVSWSEQWPGLRWPQAGPPAATSVIGREVGSQGVQRRLGLAASWERRGRQDSSDELAQNPRTRGMSLRTV